MDFIFTELLLEGFSTVGGIDSFAFRLGTLLPR